jgi:hypothetical protein
MSEFLQLDTNVPQQIALAYNDGRLVETRFGDKMFYTLTNGRTLSLKPEEAAKINALEIRRGQPFNICKREIKNGRTKSFQIDVWLPGAEEHVPNLPAIQPGAGADTPAPAAAVTSPLARVSSTDGSKPGAIAAPPANGNGRLNGGNGHNGNGAAPRVYVPVDGGFIPPTKIPMNQAVIDAVRMVQTAMKVTGEQWNDEARQGLVSTILIASERQGWLAVWEREVLQ